MKERLLALCLALTSTLCPAMQITSYNVWIDGRIVVTSDPKEDLAGARNEWTLVIFKPGNLDLAPLVSQPGTKQDPLTAAAIDTTAVSASAASSTATVKSTTGLDLNSPQSVGNPNSEHPIHMGRKEIVPAADPVNVPDNAPTALLATFAISGLVFLKGMASRPRSRSRPSLSQFMQLLRLEFDARDH